MKKCQIYVETEGTDNDYAEYRKNKKQKAQIQIPQEVQEKKEVPDKPVTAATMSSTKTFPIKQDYSESRLVTKEILKRCNIFRQKNQSVQPVKPGTGQMRQIIQTEENISAFGSKKLSHNEVSSGSKVQVSRFIQQQMAQSTSYFPRTNPAILQ